MSYQTKIVIKCGKTEAEFSNENNGCRYLSDQLESMKELIDQCAEAEKKRLSDEATTKTKG